MRGPSIAAALLLLSLPGCSWLEREMGMTSSTSSSGTSAGSITEDQARQILRDQGYAELSNLHRTAGGWEANATRNGSPVTADIDNYGIIHLR